MATFAEVALAISSTVFLLSVTKVNTNNSLENNHVQNTIASIKSPFAGKILRVLVVHVMINQNFSAKGAQI